MSLSLFITFAICFMSGGLYFASHKISRSTWIWYFTSLAFSVPSFAKVLEVVQ